MTAPVTVSDYLLFQQHESLTPAERRLKLLVFHNRSAFEAQVHQYTSQYNIAKSTSNEYLKDRLQEYFTSFVEQNYPLEKPDVISFKEFAAYCATQITNRVSRDASYQRAYNANFYKQTNNPQGKRFMPYPEIDIEKDQVMPFT